LSSPIIQVENLSKSFILSHEGRESYTALRDVISQKAKKIFSFPTWMKPSETVTKELFWALKDINFEIKQGERVGIIGRNGAGKSTLLKILSRITDPSSGSIRIKGRVASLLEVGTGFHPELTGRENIFLNGAILGMNRGEIRKKFDEIVAFAEIEKFLDTPVKRYSSGMYVRLAFAVAAHLEPEILIIDEVLAVGDAQFQQKCLGKMEDVSKNEGRTVLFVSHDLTSVEKLCDKGILLSAGMIEKTDTAANIIRYYYQSIHTNKELNADLMDGVKLTDFTFGEKLLEIGDDIAFGFKIHFEKPLSAYQVSDLCLTIYNHKGSRIFIVDLRKDIERFKSGNHLLDVKGVLKHVNLVEGTYYIGFYYGINQHKDDLFDIKRIEIKPSVHYGPIKPYELQYRGQVYINYEI